MKIIYALLLIMTSIITLAQPGNLSGNTILSNPNWETLITKSQGDSCGYYYNNYIGMAKTSIIREEPLRTGNAIESGQYNGRAQRFFAPQTIEVKGVEFFAYIKNNPSQDSLMVITMINNYDAATDSVGIELIRDTVYVKHHAFNILLPNMAVQSEFDSPIIVNSDYIISLYTPTDDSLFILANDPFTNSGNGENLGYALYDNPSYPSYTGWYAMLSDFNYDYDYLLAPLVKYNLQNSFTVINDTICPGVTGNGCVSYLQEVIFSEYQYNTKSATTNNSIFWDWGDGTFNIALTSACHTYNNVGTSNINLKDTLFKWDYNESFCAFEITKPITAVDSVIPNFTFNQSNLTANFTNTSLFSDSISWNFGDGTLAGNIDSPTHVYTTLNTFTVWLYAYGECQTDSISFQVTTDNIGLEDLNNIISIYPNPANNMISLQNLPEKSMVSLYNMMGELVNSLPVNSQIIQFNTSNFSEGSYILVINHQLGSTQHKINIQH